STSAGSPICGVSRTRWAITSPRRDGCPKPSMRSSTGVDSRACRPIRRRTSPTRTSSPARMLSSFAPTSAANLRRRCKATSGVTARGALASRSTTPTSADRAQRLDNGRLGAAILVLSGLIDPSRNAFLYSKQVSSQPGIFFFSPHRAARRSHLEAVGRRAPTNATKGGGPMRNRNQVEPSNRSANRPFDSVLAAYGSRRKVLRGGLELAAAVFFASSPGLALAGRNGNGKGQGRSGLMSFAPVPIDGGGGPMPRISSDYEMQFILPWGDPINPSSGPAFDWPPSAEAQALQIGKGHDG